MIVLVQDGAVRTLVNQVLHEVFNQLDCVIVWDNFRESAKKPN